MLVVDQDRLTRHPSERESFIAMANTLGIPLANVSKDLGLSMSDGGRFKARIMSAVARAESEKKSERQCRRNDQAARRGMPIGGKRAYGYAEDGMTVIEHEAEHIRQAAAQVLAGRSPGAVANSWNERGLRSTGGREWTSAGVRWVLWNPRYAGLLVHRREIVGEGQWPVLSDRATHERLLAALGNPRINACGRPPKNLLVGLVRWPVHRMGSSTHKGKVRRYSCRLYPSRTDCGRVTIAALAGPVLTEALRAQRGEGSEAAPRGRWLSWSGTRPRSRSWPGTSTSSGSSPGRVLGSEGAVTHYAEFLIMRIMQNVWLYGVDL